MHKVYTNIIQISGDVITVEAQGVGYLEIAQVSTKRGTSLAQVIRIDGKKVSLQVRDNLENMRLARASGSKSDL